MPSDPAPRLDLERLALGVLDPAERSELERRAQSDPALQTRIGRVRAEVEAAADLPELVFLQEQPSLKRANRAWLALVPLAAAALLATLVQPSQRVVFRGGLDLAVERVRDGRAEPQGAVIGCTEGDRIQYVVTPAKDGLLGVFDVQEDGTVSTWLAPQRVSAHVPVKGAAILDAYAGSERLFFVFDDKPFRAVDVSDALARSWRRPLADVDVLPSAWTQRSVLLVKE
jgi:hypothetical protein